MPPRRLQLQDNAYLSRLRTGSVERAVWQAVAVHLRTPLLVAAVAVVTLAGCGASPTHSAAPSAGTVAAAFKGSPPPLAALHAQANRLISGGPPAFKSLLADLRGYPVVVNKWASWCGPCQSEFPAYQQASVVFGRRVAFVGIDGKDHNGAATAFLRRFPVTYPSYVDPQESIARTIQA